MFNFLSLRAAIFAKAPSTVPAVINLTHEKAKFSIAIKTIKG